MIFENDFKTNKTYEKKERGKNKSRNLQNTTGVFSSMSLKIVYTENKKIMNVLLNKKVISTIFFNSYCLIYSRFSGCRIQG
jgi:hypothetical protein